MRCWCCAFETEVVALYCVRCGAASLREEPWAEWHRRLGVVRTLVANRVWDPLAGVGRLKRQVIRLKEIEQEPYVLPDNFSAAKKWMGAELAPALAEPDLSLRHQLCELFVDWLPAEVAPDLHEHFERLKALIPELQTGAKTAAQGSLPPAAAAAWLDSTAELHGLSPSELRRCLFATPHYWSRLAKAVDSEHFEQAQYELHLGYGYGALGKKKLPEAKANFESAQKQSPTRPAAYAGLGAIAAAQDDKPAAVRLYKLALEYGTRDARVLNDLAWYETTVTTADERDLSLALSAAQLAVTIAPIASHFDTLAEVLSERGELSAGLRAAREAYLDSPEDNYRRRIDILAGAESILQPDLGRVPAPVPSPPKGQAIVDLPNDLGVLLEPDEFSLGEAAPAAPARPKPKEPALPPPADDDEFELSLDAGDDDFSLDDFSLELPEDGDVLSLDDHVSESGINALDSGISLDQGIDLGGDDDFLLTPAAGSDSDVNFELPAMEEEFALHASAAQSDAEEFELSLHAEDSGISLKLPGSSDVKLSTQLEQEVAALQRKVDDEATAKILARVAATPRGDFSQAPTAQRDAVDCTVFAPASVPPQVEFLIQAFVHQPEREAEAAAQAKEADRGAARRGRTALATEIARGSQLTFELTCPKAEIDDPVQTLVWRGRTESVSFGVTAPAAGVLVAKLKVIQDSVPIGQIRFTIVADADLDESPAAAPIGAAKRYRSAFASYASQDRDEVLRRVQMLGAVGIRCFQDVLDLEPGDRWAQKLYEHIDKADVLFLFWSRHARQSPWVEKEWKYGLEKRGDDFIQPVIVEGPPIVPPPPDLEHLHFNDKLVYLLRPGN
jgi:tetratricopeptide (TPR) repeat protein